jgi:hypothetical protein
VSALGTDPEGYPLLYAFDFNGDGVYDTPLKDLAYVKRRFAVGTHRIRVKVVDAAGASKSVSQLLTITEPPQAAVESTLADLSSKSTAELSNNIDLVISQMMAVASSAKTEVGATALASSLDQLTQVATFDSNRREQSLAIVDSLAGNILQGSQQETQILDSVQRIAQSVTDPASAQRVFSSLSKLSTSDSNRGKLIAALSNLGKTPVLPGEIVEFIEGTKKISVSGANKGEAVSADGISVPSGLIQKDFSLSVGKYPEVRDSTVIGGTINIDLYDLASNSLIDTSTTAGIKLEVDIPAGANLANLRIAYWDVTNQVYVDMTAPDSINTITNKATFTLKHLTEFALHEKAATSSTGTSSTGTVINVSGGEVLDAYGNVSPTGGGGGGGGCLLR